MNFNGRCNLYNCESGEPLGDHRRQLIYEPDRRVWGRIEIDGGDDPDGTFDRWFTITRVVATIHTPSQPDSPDMPGGEPVEMWNRGVSNVKGSRSVHMLVSTDEIPTVEAEPHEEAGG